MAIRPKKPTEQSSADQFQALLDQIIDMRHESVRLAQEIDWHWLDTELARLFSAKGWPATET